MTLGLYDFRTVKSVPVIAKDAPRRSVPLVVDMETTLAAMKADAAVWKARKADAWGENMAVKPDRLSSAEYITWTAKAEGELEDEIIATIRRNGPLTMAELGLRMTLPCNRHKLRTMLTQMKKHGKVTNRQVSNKIHEWVIA
jgi:hypothetical protein